MLNLKILTLIFFSIALTCSKPVFGEMLEYTPITKNQRGKPFPLQRIPLSDDAAALSFKIPAGLSGVLLELELREDRSPLIKALFGKDSFEQNWKVAVAQAGCSMPSEVFLGVGDLDKNGVKDLVMLFPTCGVGLAPSVRLFSLLFEKNGKPVPFEAEGYFEGLPTGIQSLVDMDRDGHTELIYMNYDDGYWITNVYKAEKARWHRIKGNFSGKHYPLFTRFTNRPNFKAVTPKPNKHPFAPDLSNATALLVGYLQSFNIPNVTEVIGLTRRDVALNVQTNEGSLIKCTPAYWFGSARLVLDSKRGRNITFLSYENKEEASAILNKIIAKGLTVFLYGKRYADRCSPEIIWATESY